MRGGRRIGHPFDNCERHDDPAETVDKVRDWMILEQPDVAQIIVAHDTFIKSDMPVGAYPHADIDALAARFGGYHKIIETLNKIFKEQFPWSGDLAARCPGEWY